jgi:prepilin-type N-terminal cleavage/methylation domain-containing protein
MQRRGFTLIELVMVLVILTALAAGVVSLVDRGVEIDGKSIETVATEKSMLTIRDVIMGTTTQPGMWADLSQRPEFFPQSLVVLFLEDGSIQSVPQFSSVTSFDPVTKTGWRGPYLTQASGRDENNLPTVIDAWGNPIVIQIVDIDGDTIQEEEDVRYARLVSLGEDGLLQTGTTAGYIPDDNAPPNEAEEISLNECGDDIVLFFRVADTRTSL